MESLGVVVKIKKNLYEWKGLKEAVRTIESYRGDPLNCEAASKKERSL